MLEYSYLILDKFKFDDKLLMKELKKCISYLNAEETNELEHWVQVHFTSEYPVLQSFFAK